MVVFVPLISDSDESRVWISAIRAVSSARTRSARRSFGSHFATHSGVGCTHAPRPGSLSRPSGIATPCSATIRTKRRGSSRSRQPRHVRMLTSLPHGTLGRVCRPASFVEGERVRRATVQLSCVQVDAHGRVLSLASLDPRWDCSAYGKQRSTTGTKSGVQVGILEEFRPKDRSK